MPSQVRNSARAIPKKKNEKASTTPAAPNAPAPMPAFLADVPTSAFASSTSARIRVESSAMALWTSVPTEGSSVWVLTSSWADDTLWATGAPPSDGCAGSVLFADPAGQGNRAARRRAARPDRVQGPRASLRAVGGRGCSSVLRGRRRELVLDQVHHRRVGQRGD